MSLHAYRGPTEVSTKSPQRAYRGVESLQRVSKRGHEGGFVSTKYIQSTQVSTGQHTYRALSTYRGLESTAHTEPA